MKRSLDVVETGNDRLVVDQERSRYCRVPKDCKITSDELLHYVWTDYEFFLVDDQRYEIWLSPRSRVRGYVIGTSQLQV